MIKESFKIHKNKKVYLMRMETTMKNLLNRTEI